MRNLHGLPKKIVSLTLAGIFAINSVLPYAAAEEGMAGLSAAGGQFTITSAYCYAPAKDVSVYDYSQIIFAAALGFMVFGQIPDLLSWIGYFIIVAMAVLMFVYNKNASNKQQADES